MRKRGLSLLSKIITALLIVILISEIILRTFYDLSLFTLLLNSSKYYLALIDNVILFLIILLLPQLIASKLSKERFKPKNYSIQTSPSKNRKVISLKDQKTIHKKEGKGLIWGASIAIIYTLLDLFIIKSYLLPQCFTPCGIENYLGIVFSIVYLIAGILLIKNEKSKE